MKLLSLKEKAINYRKRGYSYSMISEKLGLAKSTLSYWLREVPYKPNKEVIKRVGLARLKSAKFKHRQKIANIATMKKLAKKEVGKLTKRDLFLLGIGLYLGDGTKLQEAVQITNSNPEIIRIAIKWFREIRGLNTENFTIALHTYPDNNVRNAINFWSKITGIPRKNFGKTQIDKRTGKSNKNKRKLPYGTVRLTIRANGNKDFGVNLHRRIIGWIEAVSNQV